MKTKPPLKSPTQSPPTAVDGADIWERQSLEEELCGTHTLLASWSQREPDPPPPCLPSSQTSCTGYKYLKRQSTKFKDREVRKPNPVCNTFCVLWPASSILQGKVSGTGSEEQDMNHGSRFPSQGKPPALVSGTGLSSYGFRSAECWMRNRLLEIKILKQLTFLDPCFGYL